MPSPNTEALRARNAELAKLSPPETIHASGRRTVRNGAGRVIGSVPEESYVNPDKDRTLRGKARRNARKAARRG